MPNYRFEARNSQGETHAGLIEAASVTQAAEQLAARSLEVLSVRLATAGDLAAELSTMERQSTGEYPQKVDGSERVSPVTRPDYLRRMDEALAERAGLLELLEAIAAEQSGVRLGNQLPYLIDRLKQGATSEDFLADPRLVAWLPIVMTMRNSQAWHENYGRWLTQVANEQRRSLSWWWSLSYPLFLVFITLIVLIPISVLIVPSFKRMFEDFGLTLPPPTLLLVRLSDLIVGYPVLLSTLGVALIIVLAILPSYWYSQRFTTQLFGVMSAGSIPNLLAMSRLMSVLAELIELGASQAEAIQVAGRASRHAYFEYVCTRLSNDLQTPGVHWQDSRAARALPMSLLHAMVANADGSPSVPLLREMSQMYTLRAYQRQAVGAGLLTPVIVCAVGASIGFVVIALFMPLVQLVTSLA